MLFARELREGCGYDSYPYPIPADDEGDKNGEVSLSEIHEYINKHMPIPYKWMQNAQA